MKNLALRRTEFSVFPYFSRRSCSHESRPHLEAPYDPQKCGVSSAYPVVQLPARSLWCKQFPLSKDELLKDDEGCISSMMQKLKDTRHYYQYPSLSAPQIGWNVQVFTLFDNSIYVNPICLETMEWEEEAEKKGILFSQYEAEKMRELRQKGKTCFAWEPCASCSFLLHYIERPLTCHIQALNEKGDKITTQTLEGMKARMAWHEMDHLQGILFSRRTIDANHIVPLEGFCTMSDWSDDYPSLEARSTFLYTCFTPPFTFTSYGVEDANLLDRHLEDGIYPGVEREEQLRTEVAALEQLNRDRWRREKQRQAEKVNCFKEEEKSTGNSEEEIAVKGNCVSD